MSQAPFMPTAATTTIAATASSVGGTVAGSGAPCMRIVNDTASICFVKFGIGAQTATNADYPIPANSVEVMRPNVVDPTHVAVILATGTGNVYVTRGEGY